MKKFFYILAAAAMAVTAASCQKEVIPASDGPEVSATFSVALPGNFTKAISDGQTVDQLVFGVFSGGKEIAELRQNDVPVTAGKATVTVQLVKGQTYTFAFWAQKKGTGYYDTANLSAVKVNYTGNANDETRDAFYACKADYTVAGPFTETVVLKRPFAQINVGTSDAAAAAAAGIVVEKSEMTVSGAGNTLNLLTGAVSGSVDVSYTVEAIPTETLKVKSGDAAIDAIDYQWLAMNYVLVGKAEKSLVDVTATLTFANGKGNLPLEIPNAPVQGNYRTNIVGALLTSQGTFNVIVDEEYDNPDYVVSPVASVGNKIYSTLQEAVAAATNGETVSLLDNVVVDAAINVASGVNAVLDLNGKSITANGANIQAINVNGGTLTIKGEGTVNGGKGGNNAAVFVTNGGTVTINGGNYTVGPDASNAGNPCIETKGGKVVINGGYFRTDAAWNNFYYVLNQNNSNPGTIQVKGGKFENFNPANGDDHLGGSFVADGYACVKVGTDVYEVANHLAVADKDLFLTALKAGVPTIELTADIEDFTAVIELDRDLTIVGNGHSIKNSANRVMRVTKPNLTLTFENVKLVSTCTATSDVRCLSFDDISSGSKVLIDGCELSASFYCINFITGSEGHKITLRNATVASGWAAINCYANNSVFNIENSTLRGLNDKGASAWNDFATIVFDGNGLWDAKNIGVNGSGNTVNITKSTIYASSESSNNQAWLSVQYGAKSDVIKVDADTRIIDDKGEDQTGNMIFKNIVGYGSSTEKAYDPASKVFIAGVDRTPTLE